MSSRSQLQPKQGRSPSFQFGNPNVPAYSAQSPFTYSMQAINCMVVPPKAVLPMSTPDHEGPEVRVSSQESGWVTMGPRRVGECTHKLLKQSIPQNISICSLHPTSWYTHLAIPRIGGYIHIYMCVYINIHMHIIYIYIYYTHICYTFIIYIYIYCHFVVQSSPIDHGDPSCRQLGNVPVAMALIDHSRNRKIT